MRIGFYIKKEGKELFQMKKVIAFLGFASLYPLILNVIATTPLIPLKDALYMALLVTACVSSELIYIVMMEEIKKQTFDMVLLSGYPAKNIVLAKMFFPIVLALGAVIAAIGVNNLGSFVIPKMVLIDGMDITDVIMLFLAAFLSGLSTLYLMLGVKSYQSKTLTINVAGVVAAFMGLHVAKKYVNGGILLVGVGLIAIMLYMLAVFRILNRQNRGRDTVRRDWIQFTGKEDTVSKSLRKRNLQRFARQKAGIAKLCIIMMGIIMVNSLPVQNEFYRKVMIVFENYMLITVFTMDFYYESAKQEIYARMDEILQVAGISRRSNFSSIRRGCLLIGMCAGMLLYGITYLENRIASGRFLYCGAEGISFFVLLFLCLHVCQQCVLYGLKSVKEERIVKIAVFILCCMVMAGWFGLIFAIK